MVLRLSSASEKAEVLNKFFFGCFNHNISPLLHSKLNVDLDPTACPMDILCDEDLVLDQLASLDVKKATGCDGISAKMLKCTAASIAPSLTLLFNLSISTGV